MVETASLASERRVQPPCSAPSAPACVFSNAFASLHSETRSDEPLALVSGQRACPVALSATDTPLPRPQRTATATRETLARLTHAPDAGW